jgi:hypothetical protein
LDSWQYHLSPNSREVTALGGIKGAARDELVKSGIEYTLIETGFFYETTFFGPLADALGIRSVS